MTLELVVPFIGAVLTAIFTVLIKYNANPYIMKKKYLVNTLHSQRALKVEDANIAYDIISVTYVTILGLIVITDINMYIRPILNGQINVGIVILILLSVLYYTYVHFMNESGWKKDQEDINIFGVLLSIFITFSSMYFLYFMLCKVTTKGM